MLKLIVIKELRLLINPMYYVKAVLLLEKFLNLVVKQHAEIQADILNVDAVALWLVRKAEDFGVIVAENMFGDILSDLGAGVMGGLGFAPSANVGVNGCYFEPVHGSAPRIKPGVPTLVLCF